MSNIIEPLKNKNGDIKTNVEVCKEVYKILKAMRDGKPGWTEKYKEKQQDKFYEICHDSRTAEDIMDWLEQINNESDYDKAQKLIQRTLLPVSGIKK